MSNNNLRIGEFLACVSSHDVYGTVLFRKSCIKNHLHKLELDSGSSHPQMGHLNVQNVEIWFNILLSVV